MPPIAMNTAPLKRTLSVTGLLLTGAASGVVAIKVVAPAFLSPGATDAQPVATGGEGGGGEGPSLAARTTVRPRLSASARQTPSAPREKPVVQLRPASPTAETAAFSTPAEPKPASKAL
jgi:hypothetical protein